MVNLLDRILGSTGQERTAALRDLGRRAEYYVPPELRGILGFAAEMTPSETLNRAAVAGGEMLAPGRTPMQRVGSAGRMLSETAGVAAPIAAGPRAGMTAAQSLQEGLLGFSMAADDAGRRFVERMNQPGPVPTMYSNPVFTNVEDYAGSHRAPRRDPDLGRSSLDDPRDIFGGDDSIYSSRALQYYGSQGGSVDAESMAAIKAARGNPDTEITVYRSIPKDIKGAGINAGDWVTPSRSYAESHGERALGGDYQIVEQKVRAGDLFTEGDINEWGFDPKDATPTLPAPRNEAEAMAKQVLEMRAAGRAGDVTEEMMAATDPQYMFANTPLPMDEASRMARARELGFGDDLYHGTGADFPAFYNARRGNYFTNSPEIADIYATGSTGGSASIRGQAANAGANYIPVKLRGPELSVTDKGPDGSHGWLTDNIAASVTGVEKFPLGTYPRRLNDAARSQGYGAIRMDDMLDLGGEQTQWMSIDPSGIRSRFARFDPAFAHLRNLSAGVGGLGLLSGLYSQEDTQ